MSLRRVSAVLSILLVAAAARADESLLQLRIRGEVAGTAARLQTADTLARAGRWAEAVEKYQQILEEAGHDLVPDDPKRPRHSVAARRLCQLRLAALPPEALRLYRARVDDQALQWLQQGIARRDATLLRRLVDEVFCSRHTDQALDLLGDWAFERGRFDEAERWWRMLALPASLSPPSQAPGEQPASLLLLYPDPRVDVARVRAKQLIARLFQGDRGGVFEELKAYRAAHGQAQGDLAGRQGRYADTVHHLLGQNDLASFGGEEDWPTFAGHPSRNRVLEWLPGGPTLPALAEPFWRVRLDTGQLLESNKAGTRPPEKPLPPRQLERQLAFHPVIASGQVLVADGRYITSYDLHSGKIRFRHDGLAGQAADTQPPRPPPPDLTYSLTVAGGRVYARLGAPLLGPTAREGDAGPMPSLLVCLDLAPEAEGRAREVWAVRAQGSESAVACFEGAPLVHEGRAYMALCHVGGNQTRSDIACYNAATGQRLWQREVCEVPEARDGEGRCRHHLLTLAGPYLVYATHAGVIAALDAVSGRPVWAVRYPSNGGLTANGEPSPRGLCPCVYASGRLFAAPADLDRILCLDAETGRLLWESTNVEVVQLLGVARDRLIFTTVTPRPGIRALDAATGNPRRGWLQPDDHTGEPSFGRGLLAGDLVLWPAHSGLRVLRQEDGLPLDVKDRRLGNLAAGGDCLVVAGLDELAVYLPERYWLERRRAEANAPGAEPGALHRLALAEADAGLTQQALENFARVERAAGPRDRHQGVPLRSAARRCRHELLLRLAEQARANKRTDEAVARLEQAASPEFTAAQRLSALTRLADLWRAAGRPERAASAWQTVLANAALRDSCLSGSDGSFQRGEVLALEGLATLARTPSASVSHGAAAGPEIVLRQTTTCEKSGQHGAVPCSPQGPAVRPDLSLPLARTWHHAFEHRQGRLLVPERPGDARRLFLVDGQLLKCHDAATGQPCWTRPLPCGPRWIGQHADIVLAGGADGVHALRLDDGERVWSLTRPSETELSDFRLTASRLFFLDGQQRLFALDPETGRVLWVVWAPGARVGTSPPAGRFHAPYHAGEHWLLLQTTSGRLLVLDGRTGQCLHDLPTCSDPWPQEPQAFDHHRVLLASGTEICLFDLAAGRACWKYQGAAERWPSLSGEPVRFLARDEVLLVLLARNYGYELERLDPATGHPLWRKPKLLGRTPVALDRADLDESVAYLVLDNLLQARSLDDGRLLWQQRLTGSGRSWRTVRSRQAVIAYPEEAVVGEKFLVIGCDPRDGRLIQRLIFPAAHSPAALQYVGKGLAVSAAGFAWGLIPASDP